ncbi:hypothetical protein KPH14_001747 [Odynerus spinipes]|uniref:PH domain-containing protein n=1 Tax=Odynerus spinipes TaxID=1348599 RepID=A0AAD9RZX5_9HYME|nr:hypothetical protein KPH14_001747 [Odynerus spinipes]
MGLDAEFTVILREIVQFLECLREAKLSSALETIRENLLLRSKTALSVFTMTDGTTSAAEPYLHMNASSKGLLPLQITETKELDAQEYVGAEEHGVKTDDQKRPLSQIHPDHYETFLSVVAEDEKKREQEETKESALVEIYRSFSAARAKSNSLKCGPLFRKEGKKLFVFEQYRISWVALVGTHLLIYGSERDSKPYIVKGIRGYSGRPSPNAVARDQRRSESAFEIFKPGNKTLQFVARTPKDMEQWVTKICQICSNEKPTTFDHGKEDSSPIGTITEVITEEIISNDRLTDSKIQTTFASVNESKTSKPDQDKKVSITDKKSPPPLPARIPVALSRGLPSLPRSEAISSYEAMDDEEDDIYHRIEDFGSKTCYQNMATKNREHEKSKKADSYDDVHAILKKEEKNVKLVSKEENASSTLQNEKVSYEETYDDISSASASREKKDREVIRSEDVNDTCEPQQSTLATDVSYDDVTALVNTTPPGNKVKDKDEEAQKKLSNKKSFLDRMRNRKESPQKKEKTTAARRETLTPPRIVQIEETITYDNVSELMTAKAASVPEEMAEYTCPPTPRPIFIKPPPVTLPIEEALYDDVNGFLKKKDQQLKQQQLQSNLQNLEKRIPDDDEHYKSPRSETWLHTSPSQEEEELYDDIDILANFTARRRQMSDEIKDQDTIKPSSSPDKKSWNRFVTNRKLKLNDSTGSGSNKRVSTEIMDPDSLEEQPNFSRKNKTFQKLINKMENSLGRVSPRTVPTTSMNKSCGLNTSA